MALIRSERGIGRGEVAESRVEAPFFAGFMVFCAVVLLVEHLYIQRFDITMALAVSMIVFGTTVLRPDFGVYVLVVSMLLSPEVFAGYGLSGQRPLNIRYDDILIIVIFAGVMVKTAFEGRGRLWLPNPINPGIVAYFGVCVISTLLALRANLPAWDKRTAFFVMVKMAEFYMVFFLTANAIRTRKEIRNQLVLFFIVALIVCGYCIVQLPGTHRVSAPFETRGGTEPNTLGGYLTLVIAISMGLMVYSPNRWLKFVLWAIAATAFIPFLFTLSRASYVALLATMLVLGIVGRRVLILALLAGVLVLSPIFMPDDVKNRVNYTFQRGDGVPVVVAGHDTGVKVDKSTHERIYVWGKVWYILHVAPWFGGGISWETVMDSQYARVILETGLFGLAAFLFLQFRLLKTTWETHRRGRDWLFRGLGLGMLAGTIGMIVHSLGTITFVIVRIIEPFWFLMALTTLARSMSMARTRRYTAATPKPNRAPTVAQPSVAP